MKVRNVVRAGDRVVGMERLELLAEARKRVGSHADDKWAQLKL
jgi:hypothetical protein